jgi:hypothetical protein
MTRQQLILVIGMALVLLFNFFRHLRQRRLENQRAARREPAVSERPRVVPQPPPVVLPQRPPPARVLTPAPREVARAASRPRTRAPFGGKRAVRRAIVLMSILGPCRAREPPDPRG